MKTRGCDIAIRLCVSFAGKRKTDATAAVFGDFVHPRLATQHLFYGRREVSTNIVYVGNDLCEVSPRGRMRGGRIEVSVRRRFHAKVPEFVRVLPAGQHTGHRKKRGELTILLEFLQSEAYRQLMQLYEINVVFKLSGRYWLNDDFRLLPLLELSSSAFYFKIVRVYQDPNNVAIWNNDRKDACFSTCLFGFTPDQMPRACEAFQHVFQHMQRERWDIENGLYQYFVGRAPHSESGPRFPTVFVPKIGVSGRLSGPGTLIHH
jgi:hypothetical protein